MTEIRDRNFSAGERIDIDDTKFVGCTFDGVSLRYCGGEHPTFEECNFIETGWYFDEAALRTIQLLQLINNGSGAAGSEMVAGLFQPGQLLGG